jgi:hypothetical protein
LTGLAFFTWIGLLLAAGLALVWLLVMRRTLQGLWHGELFRAPCLAAQTPIRSTLLAVITDCPGVNEHL